MMSRLLVGFAAHQCTGIVYRYSESREKYDMAQEEALVRNKPLLVVGGPSGSPDTYADTAWVRPLTRLKSMFNIKPHGCGDMCVDVDPHACQGCPYEAANLMDLPLADKEFGAAYCSHVLEHMPDAEGCHKAWSELHRVADVVFICVPPKSSIWAWFVPDHHLWVRHVGETVLEVEERNTGAKYLVDPATPIRMIEGGASVEQDHVGQVLPHLPLILAGGVAAWALWRR